MRVRIHFYNYPMLCHVNRNREKKYSTAVQPKPFESIPGLSSLPIIGGLHHFLPGIGKIGTPSNFFTMTGRLYEEFGPIIRLQGVLPQGDMVMLFEPEHFDQVYRAEDILPLRPGFKIVTKYREQHRKETDGVYGLTTAQGQQWRDFRTKVNPALLKPKLVKLYAPALDEIAQDMVARLIKLKDDQKYLQWNLDREMTKWSLESIALVCLGARLGCLQDNLTDEHPASKLIKSARDIMDFSLKLELLPSILQKFYTGSFKKLIKALDDQWSISAMYIEQAQQRIKERGQDVPEEDKSVIEKLLAVDETVAIVMANEMLMAGIDTVAFTTTALLYNLATHPRTQDRLRAEIRSGDTNRRYLKACLKEALRINPVIAANLRRTTREHIVGGYLIPKNVDIVAPNEFLSKLEKYYPRPLEFIPERWLADKTDPLYYGKTHPMITQPFGFGIRSCIGRRIAELEIEVFINRLINELEVKWEGPPIKIVTRVMNTIKKPYYFKFEPTK